jgi:hypothetical protein
MATAPAKAIVIGTDYGREEWVANLLKSLAGCKYQVMVITQGQYELGKIDWAFTHTRLEEFLFLHDAMELKRLDWLDEVFDHPHSVALTDKPCPFGMYLGKYQRKVLQHIVIPEVKSKKDSVYHESHWTHDYLNIDPGAKILWHDLDDRDHRVVEAFGRTNLLLENDYVAKYKGTWTMDQVEEIDRKAGIIKI